MPNKNTPLIYQTDLLLVFLDDFKKILSRDGKSTGIPTGATRHCRLEGCNGLRIYVRWKDGKTTYPCSKGLVATKKPGVWRIG